MANLKLSQITSATANPATTDNIVSVVSGSTDNLVTYAQAASTISPLVSVSAGTQITGTIPASSMSPVNLATTGNGGVTGLLQASNGGLTNSPAYLPNYWYRQPSYSALITGLTTVPGTVYLSPVYIAQPITVKALAVSFATAPTTGLTSYYNVGIYSNNSSNNTPSTLIANFTGTNATTNFLQTMNLSSNISITSPGYYWLAFQSSDTGLRFSAAYPGNAPSLTNPIATVLGSSSASLVMQAVTNGFSFSTGVQTSSGAANITLPTSVSGALSTLSGVVPIMAYQVASVP